MEDGHWHCDFLYVAELNGETDRYEYDDSDTRWFSQEELRRNDLNMPENVRKTALKALEKSR